jgi:hypothetical protein
MKPTRPFSVYSNFPPDQITTPPSPIIADASYQIPSAQKKKLHFESEPTSFAIESNTNCTYLVRAILT